MSLPFNFNSNSSIIFLNHGPGHRYLEQRYSKTWPYCKFIKIIVHGKVKSQ